MYYRTITRSVGNAVRLAEIVQVLVRHGFADLVRRMGLHDRLPAKLLRGLHVIEALPDEPETLGARLRAALVELGPTAVKFGQILSTRPDLVGKDIANDLGLLQDRVDTVPFEEMRPEIERELDGRLEELFADFEHEPVAAASLSQVYRATLKSGAKVAVKVQRPSIRKIIESDLNLMRRIASWTAERVHDLDWMDPVGMVDEFRRSLLRELDFTVEARIIERFRENFRDAREIFIPKTYPDLSTSRVLTMDWIDGVRVDALEEYPARNCGARAVAKIGCDLMCRQVFEHGLFHADPHPGNIMVLRNNQIAFLDYGMVGSLERTDVMVMADLLAAIFSQDAEETVRALLAFTPAKEPENREALTHEVADYIAFDAQAIVAGGEVGKAIEKITEILRRHHLQLAPRFSLLLKALATVESTGHSLDPGMNMVPVIQPYVERIVARRYSPSQLWHEAHKDISALVRLLRDLPGDLTSLMRALRRGNLKVQIHHEGLSHMAAVTDRASNRIAFGVITGSIIIGSSLLIATDTGARHIGLAGFIVAGLLGLSLLISILRSRNF